MEIFDTLKALSAAHGVSGDEGEICALIRSLAEPYADDITVDAMGNLLVHKAGPGPKLMFAAHMDSIGIVATHIDEKGFVRFGKVGGVEPCGIAQANLRFRSGRMGVVSVKEPQADKAFKLDDLYLDLGAKDKAEAETWVCPGDTAAFTGAVYQNGDCIVAPYLDNRAGCLVLLLALEQLKNAVNDITFAFTVQEEVGLRGAKTAAFAVEPDYAVVVDTTDPCDVPDSLMSGNTVLGGGAAVKVMDSSVICTPKMVEHLMNLAKEKGITAQKDILKSGGTDAGPMHSTRTGAVTGGISIPVRYLHTPTEMANINDIKACARLVLALAESELPK